MGAERQASSIIHAAGVRVGFSSFAPKGACRWDRKDYQELSGWREALDLLAEMLEVVLTDAQTEHFVDDRKEVSQ